MTNFKENFWEMDKLSEICIHGMVFAWFDPLCERWELFGVIEAIFIISFAYCISTVLYKKEKRKTLF